MYLITIHERGQINKGRLLIDKFATDNLPSKSVHLKLNRDKKY